MAYESSHVLYIFPVLFLKLLPELLDMPAFFESKNYRFDDEGTIRKSRTKCASSVSEQVDESVSSVLNAIHPLYLHQADFLSLSKIIQSLAVFEIAVAGSRLIGILIRKHTIESCETCCDHTMMKLKYGESVAPSLN